MILAMPLELLPNTAGLKMKQDHSKITFEKPLFEACKRLG